MSETRPYADNVFIKLEPLDKIGSIHLPENADRAIKGCRVGRVLKAGPGYWGRPTYLHPKGIFHQSEINAGDRVVVAWLAGNIYDWDLTKPRLNERAEFEALDGERGEFRMVREQEIIAVIEEGVLVG